MSAAVKTSRKTTFAMLAAGVACAVLAIPTATAAPAPAVDDCSAAGLSSTISSVTKSLSDYFAAHPDVNQALIDATRQPPYVAVGQFDGFFDEHPQEADEIRAIKAPLGEFQNRCGLQVEPATALVVISEL
jgi:hemophore-related protein